MKKAVVVIPTYNESANIASLIDTIIEETNRIKNWHIDILIVDSSSPDGTYDIVISLQKKYRSLHVISTKKEGLGKAYVNGFSYAMEHLNPFVLFEMDADLSHNPKNIPDFLRAVEKGADFVIGSRYIKNGSIPKNWAFYRKLFSVLGNLIVRFGFMKLRITDWTSGYRAMKVWIAKSALPHVKKYSGYVFQVALLDHAIKNRSVIKEVPIHFIDREQGVSKINSFQYIYQTILYVFSHSSFIKFALVGVLGFIIDFSLSYAAFEMIKISEKMYWLAAILIAEIAIISNFFFNNVWSFAHKKIEPSLKSYAVNFLKFNGVSSGSILIQAVALQVLTNIFGKQFWPLYKVGIVIFLIIPYSYYFYNKVIWKEK